MLCFSVCSVAAPIKQTKLQNCLEEAWIDELKNYVIEVTRAPLPDVCVRLAKQSYLNYLVGSSNYGSMVAASAFVGATQEIFLADDLNFQDHLARSYLVHELVHLQQFARKNTTDGKCIGLPESEAYSLQARYLKRHGLSEDAFLFQVIGMMHAACDIDY